MNIAQEISQSIEYGHKWVDMYALSINSHTRFVDEKLTKEQVGRIRISPDLSSFFEISNISWDKHERNGWSKPDRQTDFTEVRYLWKK